MTLPHFEENASDIPSGYGIEHSHDGGFYPYRIDTWDKTLEYHFKDEQGLDRRYATRDEALEAIKQKVATSPPFEPPEKDSDADILGDFERMHE